MFYLESVKGDFQDFIDFIDNNTKFYIFGTDYSGYSFYKWFCDKFPNKHILGFLDNDKKKWNKNFCFEDWTINLPVTNPNEVDITKQKILITSIHSDEISIQLNEYGLENLKDYIVTDNFDWYDLKHFHKNLGESFLNYLIANLEHFETVYRFLDERSKEVYSRVINYRSTVYVPQIRKKDFLPMNFQEFREVSKEKKILRLSLEKKYKNDNFLINSIVNYPYFFEDFGVKREIKNILDLGGYKADSAVAMSYYYPEANIFMFEPNNCLQKAIQKNIKQFPNIRHINKGVWKEKDILSFNISETNEASYIGNGNEYIEVIDIDNFVNDEKITSIDFIKFDIEGAEMEALYGGKKTIEKFRPILAISIYHKPSHLYEIPLWIKHNLDHYDIKIRHDCGQNVWGTLCYAIPKECMK